MDQYDSPSDSEINYDWSPEAMARIRAGFAALQATVHYQTKFKQSSPAATVPLTVMSLEHEALQPSTVTTKSAAALAISQSNSRQAVASAAAVGSPGPIPPIGPSHRGSNKDHSPNRPSKRARVTSPPDSGSSGRGLSDISSFTTSTITSSRSFDSRSGWSSSISEAMKLSHTSSSRSSSSGSDESDYEPEPTHTRLTSRSSASSSSCRRRLAIGRRSTRHQDESENSDSEDEDQSNNHQAMIIDVGKSQTRENFYERGAKS